MSHYIRYYEDQVGGGGVRNVFAGSRYQRGRGVGAFLGGLFRKILPYLASGAKAVGKEVARAGVNVLEDVTNDRASFKEAVKTRARESGKNLRKKAVEKINDMMKGSGYKRQGVKRRNQSRKKRTGVRTTAPRKQRKVTRKRVTKRKKVQARSVADIFGPARI